MNYTSIPDEFLEEMNALTDEEYGRFIRWLQMYRITGAGDVAALTGNERFYAVRGKLQIDRYVNHYNEQIEKRRAAGRKGGLARSRRQSERDGLNTAFPDPADPDELNTACPAAEDRLNTAFPGSGLTPSSNAKQCQAMPDLLQAKPGKSSQTKTNTNTNTNTNLSIPQPPSLGETPTEGQRWDGWMDRAKATEYFSERFDLAHAEERYGEHAEAVKGMAALLAEVVSDPAPRVKVGSQSVPKGRFLQLTADHAAYVAESVAAQTGKIRNPRSYLLTALYRAPETVSVRSKGKPRNATPQSVEQSAKQTAWIQDFLADFGKGETEDG